ncbi:phosphoglycerate kinase [Methanospirillum purgamenti]|uniref:Phosphoglycerate kinase n=1 Tax=Methanospirillum hungatei TaxID=2203 RepID=A0A8F5ZEI2_METHU|nr:phosphoglycerate kinase [Methanospirillum hungatei]QXO94812.1 phosphoglycerate kinase [Methanospirillum hungatei]
MGIYSKIKGLSDVDVSGKTVLLRVDFNSPIDPQAGVILDDKRFREHLYTIKALDKAKTVIITHQSRPGKKDFTSLYAHAQRLSELLGKPVRFIDDIFGSYAQESIKKANIGDVIMLENVRFNAEENLKLSGEESAKTVLIRNLARMGDIFINDAFGTAHRSQPTIVGLPEVLPAIAGLLMEREVENLSRVFQGAPRPVTFILGGTKVDDSIDVARHVLLNGIADYVLAVGVVANIFLAAKDFDIGKPSMDLIEQLGYTGQIEIARSILSQFNDKIVVPEHVAIKKDGVRVEMHVRDIPADCPILDLGSEGLIPCLDLIRSSRTVVLNGPAGLFEESDYSFGTYEIIKAAAEAEFSVVGGGHTAAVIEKMGYDSRFTHISTGGGACIEFLTGKKLPAIAALEKSSERFA